MSLGLVGSTLVLSQAFGLKKNKMFGKITARKGANEYSSG